MFVLLLPEGQAGEAWEHRNKEMLLRKKSFPYRVRSIKNVAQVEADNERSKRGFN